MSENGFRGLVNARKWGSRACKCQNIGIGGLEMSESGLRGRLNSKKKKEEK